MTETGLIFFLTAVTATFIGAVPLGLVNLSVIERSMKNDIRRANQIAYGASVVEILFAFIVVADEFLITIPEANTEEIINKLNINKNNFFTILIITYPSHDCLT